MRSERFIYRDTTVLGLTIAAWALVSLEDISGYLVGALTTLCVFLGHEWGHVLGARASGAKIGMAKSLYSPFLYNLDPAVNTRLQFLHTSHGGFLVTALALLSVYLIPAETAAAQTARWGTSLLAAATVIFEFPIYLWVAVGRRAPRIQLVAEDPP